MAVKIRACGSGFAAPSAGNKAPTSINGGEAGVKRPAVKMAKFTALLRRIRPNNKRSKCRSSIK
ncbi:Uncharacterised protein [Vibrio cholerae]|uniref:Uncharacterized protein n=1 Tax=Vibrio cholerae TaxID=666 RepID=A0A655WUG7_VIBCL|nr:Uncharacterised protein [Vibrio cholerae]